MFARSLGTAIGLVSLTMSCAAPPRDPEVAFRALEERLRDAQVIRLAFHVTAEGAVSADIGGNLEMGTGAAIRLEGRGVFAGDSVDLALETDDGQVEFGNRPDRNVADTPPELRDAILVGLTRMGVLHNLARLTGNALPDHADGGAGDWVVADSFAVDPGGDAAVSFSIFVGGQPSGSATLEISPTGLPVERRQTVHFPAGDMRVIERYSNVTIER
jgi:hypothetical protein